MGETRVKGLLCPRIQELVCDKPGLLQDVVLGYDRVLSEKYNCTLV